MKIAVFGATGSVGKLVVEQAIAKGHHICAFVRRPEKLPLNHPNLTYVQGNVLDVDAVHEAVNGQDAVIVTLGAGARGGVRSEGTRNIVKAMQNFGVKRLICQSTLGVGDSWDNLNYFYKYAMFKGLIRSAYNDHVKQEKIVSESGLDWTIVRPAAFVDGQVTGEYHHGFNGSAKGITLKISRADVAHFLIFQVQSKLYMHQTPGLSY